MANYGLSNQELISKAPAVGATSPMPGASNLYSFVPTIKAVDLLRDAGWFPMSVEQAGVRASERFGFQKHIIRFSFPDFDLGAERVDMVLANSHDRGSVFLLMASIYRKVCANGLIVASRLASFSHKHIGFSPDEFMGSVKRIGDNASQFAGGVKDMKAVDLSPAERTIFAETAHGFVWGEAKQPPVEPQQLLEERRYDDEGKDLWTTLNVIQENVIKGGIKNKALTQSGRKSRRYSKPVENIDRNIKINQALWSMAEKMQSLKSEG